MRIKKRKRVKAGIPLLLVFLLIAGVSFLSFQYFTKTGFFSVPGVVYYDESLSEAEIAQLKTIFVDGLVLKKDVSISAYTSDERPALSEGSYLIDISVPVTDFYESRSDTKDLQPSEYEYISINDLEFNKKLLAVNGDYFLDSFDSGARFRTLNFKSESFDEEIKPLIDDVFGEKSFPEKDSVLTFAQTGVTALSRGMNKKIKNVGNGQYFAENIGEYLSSFDITHTSNESSFTDLASDGNICSDWKFKDTLNSIGLDIVELTGNHNQDCGNQAAIDTIDYYQQSGIKIVGGGKTAPEAAIPLTVKEKGTNITFFAYNLSTGGATHGNSPGANQYIEELAAEEIRTAKDKGDFVIVDIQYYECSNYVSETEDTTCDYADSAAGDQVGFFRHLVDLGADLVVGTSAHQPQTYELYGDGVIYYGLGNLFFDQVWWPGTTRSLILSHYFYNNRLLQTKIVPTVFDENLQTTIMDEETKQWFIKRLAQVHP